jgi:hypothetical protein
MVGLYYKEYQDARSAKHTICFGLYYHKPIKLNKVYLEASRSGQQLTVRMSEVKLT